MQIPQLRIDQQWGKTGLNITKPKQTIQQPKADLSIQQPKADLQIDSRPATISIDQQKARDAVDLKRISTRIREFAEMGKSDWLAGMARRSQEGDRLMKIENGGSPIASIAAENSMAQMKDFNIGFIPPYGSVEISVDPGELQIDATPRKPIIEAQQNAPIIDYQPGSVETYMRQNPYIEISFDMPEPTIDATA